MIADFHSDVLVDLSPNIHLPEQLERTPSLLPDQVFGLVGAQDGNTAANLTGKIAAVSGARNPFEHRILTTFREAVMDRLKTHAIHLLRGESVLVWCEVPTILNVATPFPS